MKRIIALLVSVTVLAVQAFVLSVSAVLIKEGQTPEINGGYCKAKTVFQLGGRAEKRQYKK